MFSHKFVQQTGFFFVCRRISSEFVWNKSYGILNVLNLIVKFWIFAMPIKWWIRIPKFFKIHRNESFCLLCSRSWFFASLVDSTCNFIVLSAIDRNFDVYFQSTVHQTCKKWNLSLHYVLEVDFLQVWLTVLTILLFFESHWQKFWWTFLKSVHQTCKNNF